MKNINRVILTLLFAFSILYSKSGDSVKHMQDSILKVSENNFNKKSKKQTSVFISLKGGHHTLNYDYEGLKSAQIAGLSFGGVVNRHWVLGISFDYSTSTVYNYQIKGSGTIYDKKYKEFGVSLILKYKFYFLQDKANLTAGICLGNYSFKYSGSDGGFNGDQYLNAGISSGIGVKILPFLSLDFEWSLYRLLIMSENHRSLSVNNFRIGPTFYLSY